MPMHTVGVLDLVIACLVSGIGIYCFTRGIELWQARNGAWTTRAICGVLWAKGVWAFSVLVIVGYLWKHEAPVPAFSFWVYTAANIVSATCWGFLLYLILPTRSKRA